MKKIVILIFIASSVIAKDINLKEKGLEYYQSINVTTIKEYKKSLVLDFTGLKKNIVNDDIKHLQYIDDVECIHLSGNKKITDEGLQYLKGLEKLRILNLDDTNITDEGLKYLKDLKSLRELDLINTKVTDKGIQQLSGLKELNTLLLHGTKVTKKGIDELKKKLPDCYITLESREELH